MKNKPMINPDHRYHLRLDDTTYDIEPNWSCISYKDGAILLSCKIIGLFPDIPDAHTDVRLEQDGKLIIEFAGTPTIGRLESQFGESIDLTHVRISKTRLN